MSSKQPLVSVILSVFNGENYVKEAIKSVLKQDYPQVELVIVNDGSTDGTGQILQDFAGKAVIITQDNKGLGSGRNAGVNGATGTYLSFIDHDDFWESNKLSSQMTALLSSKQDPLVFSHVRQFICPSLNTEQAAKLRVPDEPMPGFIAGTMLLSKARFKEVGDFLEVNQVGEFVDWYLRAQESNIPIKLLNEVLLHRRIHLSNMGRQPDHYQRLGYLKILKASLTRRRATSKVFNHE